jgi:transcriptional regulator
MYVPEHFRQSDRQLLLEVMRAHSFALLISSDDSGEPFASHLPLVVSESAGAVRLEGHMARANPHWHYLERDSRALVVFAGPHGYISPSLYESKQSVPTWNYVTVHAYGRATLLHDPKQIAQGQQKLITRHDPAYRAQYAELDREFHAKLLAAIVAFQIDVERLQGKFKLSQNRPATDRRNVMEACAAGDAEQRALAKWMDRLGL